MMIVTDVIIPFCSLCDQYASGTDCNTVSPQIKVGQTEREEGLQTDCSDRDTDNGCDLSDSGIADCPVLCKRLSGNHCVLILTFYFGIIGFLDDYIKVVLKRNLGLRMQKT